MESLSINTIAEESLCKKYKKDIFTPFCKAINQYNLISPGDKIAVCMSGGKDSFIMAKLFMELKRHNKIPFELVFLCMDPGYSTPNLKLIKTNAKTLNIPLTIFKSDIFKNVEHVEKSPCYLCARMRRGHLYAKAKKLGCNKIALGHHFDDTIETTLMGMLFSGQFQTMMPKIKSKNWEGMTLIRPMYFVREQFIINWAQHCNLQFLQCACKFTQTDNNCHADTSRRQLTKKLIASLSQTDPNTPANIFASTNNVNLSTILSYKDKSGTIHNFYED